LDMLTSLLQLASLILWSLTLRRDFDWDITEFRLRFYWAIYSAVAAYKAFTQTTALLAMLWYSSGTTWRERFFKVQSVAYIAAAAINAATIYLMVTTGDDPRCDSKEWCQRPMAAVLAVLWITVLFQLRAIKSIGCVLMPIMEATWSPAMRGMGAVLLFGLIAFSSSLSAVMREYSFHEMYLRSYYLLVIAEPDLFDSENYNDPGWRYFAILGMYFAFTIVLMNVFIAITGESYRKSSQHAEGSFLVERKNLCKGALLVRQLVVSLTKVLRLSRLRCMLVILLILMVPFGIAMSHDSGDVRTGWVMFVAWSLVIYWSKMYITWMHVATEQDWERSDHYLWICTPKKTMVPRTKEDLLTKFEEALEKNREKTETAMEAMDAKIQQLVCAVIGDDAAQAALSRLSSSTGSSAKGWIGDVRDVTASSKSVESSFSFQTDIGKAEDGRHKFGGLSDTPNPLNMQFAQNDFNNNIMETEAEEEPPPQEYQIHLAAAPPPPPPPPPPPLSQTMCPPPPPPPPPPASPPPPPSPSNHNSLTPIPPPAEEPPPLCPQNVVIDARHR